MNGLSNRKQWLSTHLYYAEPWEDFLIYGIKPFIEDIKARKLADQFFFIRYWLKGPHIRLRIKGDHHVLKNELKPYLITYFKGFFHQKPSTRKKSAWSKNEKPYQQWLPNNSIQFINYEPETKRYGGKEAIALAEFQFESSSTAVLTVLEENLGSWDYDMAMGYALQLHLSFAFAIGMNLQETSKYFNAVFENWLPQAFCFYEDQINEMELQNKKKNTLKAFAQKFNDQKSTLIPFCEKMWKALTRGEPFELQWLSSWIEEMRRVGLKLADIQDSNLLVPPYTLYPFAHGSSDYSKKNINKWMVYDSYTHMTNNRLGILNRDEGYLAYLISESTLSLLGKH